MSDGGTSESAGGERDAISARNSAISASRVFLAACAADRRVVTVLCAMLCQEPFIPHDTTSQETSRGGVLQHFSRLTSQETKQEKSAKYCARPMAMRIPGHLRWPALVVCDDVTGSTATSGFCGCHHGHFKALSRCRLVGSYVLPGENFFT